MPIHGLMTRGRMPVLGKIRLGVKVQNARGGSYPKETPYFVVPPELVPIVGDKPTSIRVRFPTSNLEKLCDAWFLLYEGAQGSGKLARKCDGQAFEAFGKDGTRQTGQCLKKPYEPCVCKATASAKLSVVIEHGPVGIYWVLLGGESRIGSLVRTLDFHLDVLERVGLNLTTFPFDLVRVPTQEEFIKDGKRAKREGYPVGAHATYTWADLEANDRKALPTATLQVLTAGESPAPLESGDRAPEHHDETVPVDEPSHEGEHVEAEDLGYGTGAPAESPVAASTPNGGTTSGAAEAGPAPSAPGALAPEFSPATREDLETAIAKAGIGPGLFWPYVKAKYPGLTEAGTPGVYGILLAQIEAALAAGESAVVKLRGEYFKAIKEAAKGGRP